EALGRLGGGRARLPAHALRAEPRRDEVGEDRREARVRREVGEEAWMVPVRDAGQDVAFELVERARELPALARRLGREAGLDLAGRDAAHDRALGDPLAVVGDPVDELVAESPALLG